MSELVDAIGKPAMLEQTAEEASELAFACLKMARSMRNENPVHWRTNEEMYNNLVEECADIIVCLDELLECELVGESDFISAYDSKRKRMKKRLKSYKDGVN